MTRLLGVLAAAAEVEIFCQSQHWQFCFIGGIAVQRWGTPRFTQDVDLTLFIGLAPVEPTIDAVLRRFTGRLSKARQFAIERRVLLVRTGNGIDIDMALGVYPFEEACIRRASSWQINSQIALTTCSAEDLVIHKVFAARDRDWGDVETILARQYGKLDWEHIRRELPPLLQLKEDPDSFNKLERLIAIVDARLRPV